MDLFLLPSKFEGMGIVFLEAQCTGLPCFGSTNVPIETEVTELMHRISLKQEANYWATAMKKLLICQEIDVVELLNLSMQVIHTKLQKVIY